MPDHHIIIFVLLITYQFQWVRVGGSLSWVDSGIDLLVGISKHRIYMRTGMSAKKHTGVGWKRIAGGLMQISTFGPHLWGVNKSHSIWVGSFLGGDGNKRWGKGGGGGRGHHHHRMKRRWSFKFGGWKRVGGALMRVSCGRMGIWGVNKHHHIYYWAGGWKRYAGALVDISSGGHEIWGVNKAHQIYRRRGKGGWKRIPGRLQQVSVSQRDHVWGIWKQKIYRWTGKKWVRIGGGLQMVDVGPSGVWGCNKAQQIWHQKSTYGDLKNHNGSGVNLKLFSFNQ